MQPPLPPQPDVSSDLTVETHYTDFTDPNDSSFIVGVEPDRQLLTQEEMDYFVAKLSLNKRQSEFATSFLKHRGFTADGVNATAYRNRQALLQRFYTADKKNTYAYCHDVKGLCDAMTMLYIPSDWRIFIDGSVTSLKAVLLHKSNKKPSIPLAFSTDKHEEYETMKGLLHDLKYYEHKWKVCCDLKIVNILQGIIEKGGFPKYFCFLCNWDSRYKGDQYKCTSWKKRNPENEKKLKLRNDPLIKNRKDILLPPLHIKLGITKKFIEVAIKSDAAADEAEEEAEEEEAEEEEESDDEVVMDEEDDFSENQDDSDAEDDDVAVQGEGVFDCLKAIFPKLSDAKIKSGSVYNFFSL